MTCGYADKGCAKAEGCGKDYDGCATAKYFDYLVGSSDECRNNSLKEKDYVALWRMREKIDPKCEGCNRVDEFDRCRSFTVPSIRWPEGEATFDNKCVMATHLTPVKKKSVFVNPLKLSKRRNR